MVNGAWLIFRYPHSASNRNSEAFNPSGFRFVAPNGSCPTLVHREITSSNATVDFQADRIVRKQALILRRMAVPMRESYNPRMKNFINNPAPDFCLPDISANQHQLSDYRGRWLLLVFHRQLGCLPCRHHVTQLSLHQQRLKEQNIDVAIVTFDEDFMAKAYVQQTALPWPLLIDQQHGIYEAYRMGRASWWSIYRPRSIWNYLKLIFKGNRLHQPGSDYRQLGGDVLIDPEGIIRLYHPSESPHDRPQIESLFNAVAAG